MKKINLLFVLLAFFGMATITSCGTEDSTETPLLTLSPSSNQTALAGTAITIDVTAGQNPTSKSALKTLVVDANGTASDTTVTFPNNTSTYTETFTVYAPAAGQENVVTFTLTDKAGLVTTKSITITGTSGAGTITSYTAVLMGAQSNATTGSAFASTNGQVYLKSAAASNSALIDFVYFYGASNLATIAAPNDPSVNGVASNSVDLTDTYPTQNATVLMSTSITASEFNLMTDDSNFPTVSGSTSLMNMLSSGDVFAFETVEGKVGLVHVSTITGTQTGSITINVKVQD